MFRSTPPSLASRRCRENRPMTVRPLAIVLALLGAVAAVRGQAPQTTSADAAFVAFWQAGNKREAAAAADRIVESGVGLDEAFTRLRQGKAYSRDVPRGLVQASYRSESGEYFYTLDVPESYVPDHKYQVRVQLHGGVGRYEDNAPRPGARGQLSGAEQIYV